jgi:4-diphosphocytidyl-2-C-methyl-D-erythritol kinase
MIGRAFAPAKINLFLHVGPPGADGYHPLCSLMAFADVGDWLEARPADALKLEIVGPYGPALGDDIDNLVLRAAWALAAQAGGKAPGAYLKLEKNLPVASGLGGGSSDAGAALRLLRETLSVKISDADLQDVAASLGADGAACLWGRPVLAQGRGERLSAAPEFPVLDAVLVNPGVESPTPEVYRGFDDVGAFGNVEPPSMPETFANAAAMAAWLAAQRNDLETPAIALAPEIGEMLQVLGEAQETLLARVSGSGATVFALCAGEAEARRLAARLEAEAPHWWVRCCRLGGPWPDEAG